MNINGTGTISSEEQIWKQLEGSDNDNRDPQLRSGSYYEVSVDFFGRTHNLSDLM